MTSLRASAQRRRRTLFSVGHIALLNSAPYPNAVVSKKPSVVGYDFAQEEKGTDYQKADEILGSAMRVHRTILPKVIFQIENLINLDQIGPTAKVIALPAKWKTESAPARVIAILDS